MGRGERPSTQVLLAPGNETPCEFARAFVRESSLIEDIALDESDLLRPWDAQDGHLLAYRDCVEHALSEAPLSALQLRAWQGLLAREQRAYGEDIEDRDIGAFRIRGVSIGGREGVNSYLVPSRIENLLKLTNLPLRKSTNDNEVKVKADGFQATYERNGLVRAGRLHLAFELIHPFADGNGRTGRLLAHWVLVRAGVDPVLFTNADKYDAYYPCFTSKYMSDYFIAHQQHPSSLL